MRSRFLWIPIVVAVLSIPIGFEYVEWSRSGTGAGLYSHEWSPDPVQSYWDPVNFYEPPQTVQGTFQAEQCIQCHSAVTPGITNDWYASNHSKQDPPVACPDCHGSNHQTLHLPTPDVCGGCHEKQHGEFLQEARYGFPSHVLAMERAVDAPHFVDKPKAEVQSCVQCHSVATKCDSCHTRHKFEAAEARRPEACITCHSGPPHPDDETYFASAHGQIYLAEGEDWDWSQPLRKGNYKAPTCAYCHMTNGQHQVADKAIWKFGIKEINPNTASNKILRERWIAVCADCHESQQADVWLKNLDKERSIAWDKLYSAENLLKEIRNADAFWPSASERPSYPNSFWDAYFPFERIGFYEGQASAFYNVSAIERDYFEMWYFDNLGAYKAAAHGDFERVEKQHTLLDLALENIRQETTRLLALNATAVSEQEAGELADIWKKGPYTEMNRERN